MVCARTGPQGVELLPARSDRSVKQVIRDWLSGEVVQPYGVSPKGAVLYSYGLPIAVRYKATGGHWVVKMVPGPRVSRTTQRHRRLVRELASRAGVVLVDFKEKC